MQINLFGYNPVQNELPRTHLQTCLQQARNEDKKLILYADQKFNLKGDSSHPTQTLIPVEVQWQLLHASKRYMRGYGLNLQTEESKDFGFKHLSEDNLALLFRILRAYHVEYADDPKDPSFVGKYVDDIKEYLKECVATQHNGEKLIEALQKLGDSSLNKFINLLQSRRKEIYKHVEHNNSSKKRNNSNIENRNEQDRIKIRKYSYVDAKQELESGICLTKEILQKLEKIMYTVVTQGNNGKYKDKIEWFHSRNRIFKLEELPEVIFKTNCTGGDLDVQKRFKHMVQIKRVCHNENLDKVSLPNAKIINLQVNGMDYSVIAEQSLTLMDPRDILYDREHIQEELYYRHQDTLDEAIRQLTRVVLKTGLRDLNKFNIPLQDASKIALVDVEFCDSVENGFCGHIPYGKKEKGVIDCAQNERQLDLVIEEGKKEGLKIDYADARNKRMAAIQVRDSIEKLHKKKDITDLNKASPLVVDLDSLGLDLDENTLYDEGFAELKPISMREFATKFLGKINTGIMKKGTAVLPPFASRNISIHIHEDLRLPQEPSELWIDNAKRSAERWPHKFLQALKDKGHIADFESPYGKYVIYA